MNKENYNFFHMLGAEVELASNNISDDSYINMLCDNKKFSHDSNASDESSKIMARCFRNILVNFHDENNQKEAIKIASVMDHIANKSSNLNNYEKKFLIKAATSVKALGLLSAIPSKTVGLLGVSIPALAALLGGAYYMGEREINEDSKEIEKDKAKTIAYRTLTADIVRRLKNEGLTSEEISEYLDNK